tara:strand:+ start:8617 stop:9570 length:954 start_codon:yes stop_codon:yes gene_type:complete
MPNMNLLKIAQLNGSEADIGLIEDVLTQVPELAVFAADVVAGTSYKTVTRTSLPPTGFRTANEGIASGSSVFKSELIEMYIVDGQLEMDKRVAEADSKGVAHVLGIEASGVALSAMITLANQLYYGVSADAKGFPGLKAFSPFGGAQTTNAAGTTASTASSVFAVKFGTQDARMLWGGNTALTLGEWRIQQLKDANSNPYTGFVNDLGGWAGLQLGNQYCVSRIANLTEDSGKGLTEDLVHDMLGDVPVAKKPDAIFMSRRSMKQLRQSMAPSIVLQSTSLGGLAVSESAAKAQIEESTGVTVIVSDSIVNTDAIES